MNMMSIHKNKPKEKIQRTLQSLKNQKEIIKNRINLQNSVQKDTLDIRQFMVMATIQILTRQNIKLFLKSF